MLTILPSIHSASLCPGYSSQYSLFVQSNKNLDMSVLFSSDANTLFVCLIVCLLFYFGFFCLFSCKPPLAFGCSSVSAFSTSVLFLLLFCNLLPSTQHLFLCHFTSIFVLRAPHKRFPFLVAWQRNEISWFYEMNPSSCNVRCCGLYNCLCWAVRGCQLFWAGAVCGWQFVQCQKHCWNFHVSGRGSNMQRSTVTASKIHRIIELYGL